MRPEHDKPTTTTTTHEQPTPIRCYRCGEYESADTTPFERAVDCMTGKPFDDVAVCPRCRREPERPIVHLIGADGNAFNVIGRCMRAARRASWSGDERKRVLAEMTSGDYEHLLQTVMLYFDVR